MSGPSRGPGRLPGAPVSAPADAPVGPPAPVDARWLDALQRVVALGAHEINNALNGAVVNLEVVRLRAVPGGDAGALSRFAAAGASQLEGAVRLAEALVALARAPRGAADVALTLRQVAILVAPAAAHRGVRLEVEDAVTALPTAAPASAVRWAVAEALLAALAADGEARSVRRATLAGGEGESAGNGGGLDGALPAPAALRVVRCALGSAPGPTVRVCAGAALRLPPGVAELLGTCDVGVGYDGPDLTLAFPPLGG